MDQTHTTRFRDLSVGQSFDWIDDCRIGSNSFYLRCSKRSTRTYTDSTGMVHRVGSINANVYHVDTRD
jgi:hypothetical protein